MKNKYITKDGFVRLDEEFWEKYTCVVDRGEWVICRRKGTLDSYVLGRWAEGRTRMCMASEVSGMRGLKSDGYGLVPLRFVWDMLDMDRVRVEEEEPEERAVEQEEAIDTELRGLRGYREVRATPPPTLAGLYELDEAFRSIMQPPVNHAIIDQEVLDRLRTLEQSLQDQSREVEESQGEVNLTPEIQRGIRE